MKNIFLRYWLPLLTHMALIYYLSSRSTFPVTVPPWAFYADKVVHAVMFGFLGFLFIRAWLQAKWGELTFPSALLTLLFVLIYGISDEIHQIYVPGRNPSVSDVLADVIGGMLVIGAIAFLKRKTLFRI